MTWEKFKSLEKQKLVSPPKWLSSNIHYAVTGGSVSYGASMDNGNSDVDVVGWVMPPLTMIFPTLGGHIPEFGPPPQKFTSWEQHHVNQGHKTYDITFNSVVKFFDLAANGNPNIVDQLYVREELILFASNAGRRVRDNRHLFLSKNLWPKFRGYSVSHVKLLDEKKNASNPKRAADIEKNGFDTKFAYHCVRLLCEAEQLITHGDMDLMRDKELYKAIRNGDMSKEEIKRWHNSKSRHLEKIFEESKTLPDSPRWAELSKLLTETIESHYGSLDGFLKKPETTKSEMLDDLRQLLEKHS